MAIPTERTESFQDLVRRRCSCRAYRPDPVPRECIEAMLEAARLAPSACNRQPWRFAVVQRPEARRRLLAEGILPGLGMQWLDDAPVLIALGARISVGVHWLAPLVSHVDYPWLDLGIAGEHMVLQAAAFGLGTCWIGWIRPAGVRRAVGWPRSIRPAALLSVGWPQEGADVPRRPRMALSEMTIWIE